MAVYERTYRRYEGALTDERTRFLVFPRYAYEEVLRSKLFIAYLAACLLWPFGLACVLYIPHNLGFLEAFQLDPEQVKTFLPGFGAGFFLNWFMLPHMFFSLILTFVVGPALVSSDTRNNGLALYFSRPITRREYVLGKMLVLATLLSAITWVPGMALFVFQSYLEGASWIRENYRVGIGIFVGMWLWILVLGLISLALSAYVKWKPVARLSLIVVFFVLPGMSTVLNGLLRTEWAGLLDIGDMVYVVWARILGIPPDVGIPLWGALLSLGAVLGICLLLLARKLQPYEVVR